ncbi:MAG: BPL-N domain-containing protein [Bacillota bacterium]
MRTLSCIAVGLTLVMVLGAAGTSVAAETAESGRISGLLLPVGAIADGFPAYAGQLRACRLVNIFMRLGLPAFWIAEPFEYGDDTIPSGSFWVPMPDSTPGLARLAKDLAGRMEVPYTTIHAGRGTGVTSQIRAFRLKPVRVAVYQGDRTYSGASDVASSLELVGAYPRYVTDAEIRRGALGGYDIFVMPGGAQDVQSYALGPVGKAHIRSFVESGGGYIGICAGAYLASTSRFELNLVDAPSEGRGVVGTRIAIRQRSDRHPLFWGYDDVIFDLYYGGGPNFVADHRAIAVLNGVPPFWKSSLEGSAPFIEDTCGKGKVLLMGPHPENSQGAEGAFGMPRLFANAIFYMGSSDLEQIDLEADLTGSVASCEYAGGLLSANLPDAAVVCKRIEDLEAALDEISCCISQTCDISARLDGKTERSRFFWNYCYFGWTMKEPVRRICELPVKLTRLAEDYEELKQAVATFESEVCEFPGYSVIECMLRSWNAVEAVCRDLAVLQPLWRRIAEGMAEIERDVDALLAREKAGAVPTELDWWRLNIREYMIAIELVGGLNWRYWVSEDSTEETVRTGYGGEDGDPIQTIAAATERGAIGILTMNAMRLHEVLEANLVALAIVETMLAM